MNEPPQGYPKKIDITNCDREPIHIIGSLQSHGVIIACDQETLLITQCSENSRSLFGHEARDLIGKTLDVLLPRHFLNRKPAPLEKFTLPQIEIFNALFLIVAIPAKNILFWNLNLWENKLPRLNFRNSFPKF